MDVKKSAGSPTAAAGVPTAAAPAAPGDRTTKVGFDYVHSLVDDHSRLAYSEVLPDEKGPTCAGFLDRARRPTSPPTASPGSSELMTDNAGPTAGRYAGLRRTRHPSRSSSGHTAPGRTARSNASTDPAHRVGLPPGLHQQRRTRRRPCTLARALQHSTPPQRTPRTPTDRRRMALTRVGRTPGGAGRWAGRPSPPLAHGDLRDADVVAAGPPSATVPTRAADEDVVTAPCP